MGWTDTAYIYIIRCNEYYKIGVAHNVGHRLYELQTGNPYPLEIVGSYPAPRNMCISFEGTLHSVFEQCGFRVRGEWFIGIDDNFLKLYLEGWHDSVNRTGVPYA
jgi:hypothetical protein